jgi:putative oxygen-independent coproporphyrinogen III oxidase
MTETLSADAPALAAVSLYVHVPFCVSKCVYCDFYSVASRSSEEHARFVDAALSEVGLWSRNGLLDDVPTVYLGGGTPTVLGSELVRLVRGLTEAARVREDAEITVETNPETTGEPVVSALVDAGVNRFSLGVQSFDDEVLRVLGRCHDAAAASRALEVLRDSDAAFSLDLICGIPGQSFASWDDTLEQAVASGARHMSVYPLTVEEGTPLALAVAQGRVAAPDPDVAADMMLSAEVGLAAAGLYRYEVANYAQPGHEARHNLVYWTGGEYLGIGPHAASMLSYALYAPIAGTEGFEIAPEGRDTSRVRFTRETALPDYIRSPVSRPGPVEFLTVDEAAREDVMLGLRLRSGVSAAQVARAGLDGVLARLESRGLVRSMTDADGVHRWSTTQRGWLLGNEVFGSVWAGE